MKPITYSLQFRGQALERDGRLVKQGRSPGCSLVTKLTQAGVESRYLWAPDDNEALFESLLAFTGPETFEEEATTVFARSHALRARAQGRISASPDVHLRQGAALWEVTGGEGQFERASGRIASQFFLSDTGDLTEHQLGVIFTRDRP